MEFDFEQKQGFILGLGMACPFNTPQPNCPVKDLREVSVEKRVLTVKNMDEHTLSDIVKQHRDCISRRDKEDAIE